MRRQDMTTCRKVLLWGKICGNPRESLVGDAFEHLTLHLRYYCMGKNVYTQGYYITANESVLLHRYSITTKLLYCHNYAATL